MPPHFTRPRKWPSTRHVQGLIRQRRGHRLPQPGRRAAWWSLFHSEVPLKILSQRTNDRPSPPKTRKLVREAEGLASRAPRPHSKQAVRGPDNRRKRPAQARRGDVARLAEVSGGVAEAGFERQSDRVSVVEAAQRFYGEVCPRRISTW